MAYPILFGLVGIVRVSWRSDFMASLVEGAAG
jgi:hypothetical protein